MQSLGMCVLAGRESPFPTIYQHSMSFFWNLWCFSLLIANPSLVWVAGFGCLGGWPAGPTMEPLGGVATACCRRWCAPSCGAASSAISSARGSPGLHPQTEGEPGWSRWATAATRKCSHTAKRFVVVVAILKNFENFESRSTGNESPLWNLAISLPPPSRQTDRKALAGQAP